MIFPELIKIPELAFSLLDGLTNRIETDQNLKKESHMILPNKLP